MVDGVDQQKTQVQLSKLHTHMVCAYTINLIAVTSFKLLIEAFQFVALSSYEVAVGV